MTKDLEQLEKSFILDEDMEHENIKELVLEVQKYCKIDKNGFVLISAEYSKNLKIQDKLMLILSARYLGNKLQTKLGKESTILEEVKSKEIGDMLKEKQLVINARLKELKDKNFAIPIGRGNYKVAPYSIQQFLDSLKESKS